ncbi:hypothetical protein H4582DRAFT_2068221 [Lactarius indigo]|nr:hypothetical protein H4582DRAFT_2068221 [Lactarius indigo]
MYLNSAAEAAAENSGSAAQMKQTIIYEHLRDRWEVSCYAPPAFAVLDSIFQHVPFAISVSTVKGSGHINYIAGQIAGDLIAATTKKNKAAVIKLWIFLNALAENPTFDGQTKETVSLLSSKFGTKPMCSGMTYRLQLDQGEG